jgi:phosphopentomutase
MKYKRIFLIVLDSLGVGALEDAAGYGDENTNTLGHISFAANGLHLPVLEKLGIGNITEVKGVKAIKKPGAYITKAKEASVGKDTMTGHWEMMGIKTDIPLKTFTEKGFPKELIFELEEQTGRKFIGNISSSGTEIIENLGKRHEDTGELILYTSADSVMQYLERFF